MRRAGQPDLLSRLRRIAVFRFELAVLIRHCESCLVLALAPQHLLFLGGIQDAEQVRASHQWCVSPVFVIGACQVAYFCVTGAIGEKRTAQPRLAPCPETHHHREWLPRPR